MFNRFLKSIILITFCATNFISASFSIVGFFNDIYKKVSIDPMTQNTMSYLAKPIAKVAKQKNLAIHVIETPSPNAFATLKQRMFIFEGIIKLLPEAGQCAGVIAHEMGHLSNNHICKGINNSIKTQKGALALTLGSFLIGFAFKTPPSTHFLSNATLHMHIASLQGVRRVYETEADKCGNKYMKDLNWSPYALAQALSIIRDIRGKKTDLNTNDIYHEHPNTYKRIRALLPIKSVSYKQQNANQGIDFNTIFLYKIVRARFISKEAGFAELNHKFSKGLKNKDPDALWAYLTYYIKHHNSQKAEAILRLIKINIPHQLSKAQKEEYTGYTYIEEAKILSMQGKRKEALEKLKLTFKKIPSSPESKLTFVENYIKIRENLSSKDKFELNLIINSIGRQNIDYNYKYWNLISILNNKHKLITLSALSKRSFLLNKPDKAINFGRKTLRAIDAKIKITKNTEEIKKLNFLKEETQSTINKAIELKRSLMI